MKFEANKRNTILITCARNHVPYLINELISFGYEIESEHETGVTIEASWNDCMNINLRSRIAFNVLYLLHQSVCDDTAILYKKIYEMDWENIIPANEYLSVVSRVVNPCVNNTMFVNQKVKDAIVDRIKDHAGKRPSSGPIRKNAVINIYWQDSDFWVYLNTSGQKLSDRSYRKNPVFAPLQETLAASILSAADYDGSTTLINPMCGSGTIAIEAALIALKKAPGLLRPNFGFKHTHMFDEDTWQQTRKQCASEGLKAPIMPIVATDNDANAIKAAKQNAKTAGVEHIIDFSVCDFRDTPIPEVGSTIIMNPEYGKRMGEAKELEILYKDIGDFFKNKCKGNTTYVFTGNRDLIKFIHLKTSKKFIFLNGDIDCRLLKYDMY